MTDISQASTKSEGVDKGASSFSSLLLFLQEQPDSVIFTEENLPSSPNKSPSSPNKSQVEGDVSDGQAELPDQSQQLTKSNAEDDEGASSYSNCFYLILKQLVSLNRNK